MGAVLSDCGRYRYALDRGPFELPLGNPGGLTVLFIMLNPSTADAAEDDPTIRRCIGFARTWGYERLTVANLYGYRATKPADLWNADDPIGPDNDEHLVRLAREATRVVAAWGGDIGPEPGRDCQIIEMVPRGLTCLGFTKSGRPRHPLYVKGDAEPEFYAMGEPAGVDL